MINQLKILNPQALISIFGMIPEFEQSELLEVHLRRDGPNIVIRLMTKETVENKPKRWNKWDVIYIEISFFCIQNLKIKDMGTNNIIEQFEIDAIEEEGLLKIKCRNQMQVECLFSWAKIEKITPGLIGTH
ncbi:immunity 50 family protein [Bacillus cereus]|uniref:immunity 50 family protein n=1 Tax=Bacillus cereus TaxID=1396 RepID=UPI003980EC6C